MTPAASRLSLRWGWFPPGQRAQAADQHRPCLQTSGSPGSKHEVTEAALSGCRASGRAPPTNPTCRCSAGLLPGSSVSRGHGLHTQSSATGRKAWGSMPHLPTGTHSSPDLPNATQTCLLNMCPKPSSLLPKGLRAPKRRDSNSFLPPLRGQIPLQTSRQITAVWKLLGSGCTLTAGLTRVVLSVIVGLPGAEPYHAPLVILAVKLPV